MFRRLLDRKRKLGDYQLPVYAAYGAFFLVLSLFPAMTLLMALLGRLALSQGEFFSAFYHLIPQVLLPLFREASQITSLSAPVLSISALTLLWSASRGIYGLLKGLRRICPNQAHRSYLFLRLQAMGCTAAMLFALLLTFSLYCLGQRLWGLLGLGGMLHGLNGAAALFLFMLFSLIFRTIPQEHRTLRQTLPGSLVTTVGWIGFSRLFSLWASAFHDYSQVYGSVAVMVMAMLWLYFCLLIVLFGALLNEELLSS